MENPKQCFNCKTEESQIPLIVLTYNGQELHICPRCMPAIIHQTESIAGNLPPK
ncbi:MAG: hypothetical protein H6696_01970 [Deferribacteres bacterium]|nr:hypothetical protein [candidate division KSB1 bacterium]MCB9500679.1 hypothetical protein [Deferribacteres bacterium]